LDEKEGWAGKKVEGRGGDRNGRGEESESSRGQRGKKVRARKQEQESEEGAGSPLYSVRNTWLLPGNCGG